MATAVVDGNLTDVGGGHLVGKIPEIVFTLNMPNAKAGKLHPTQPVVVPADSDGDFAAPLETTTDMLDNAWYTVQIRWLDAEGEYVRVDFPYWKLQVPETGGSFSSLFGSPPTNQQMVFVSLTPPNEQQRALFTMWWHKDPDDDLNPLNTFELYRWRTS